MRKLLIAAGLALATLAAAPANAAAPQIIPGAQTLDRLPVECLHTLADPEWLEGIGCRTLGQVRRLPRAGLSRRIGTELLARLDQAYGQIASGFAWFEAPPAFAQRMELPGRVESAEGVLAGAQRLLLALSGWLAVQQAEALEQRASTLNRAVAAFRLQQGTAEEAVALVRKAVELHRSTSREQFLGRITDKAGGFHDRDMYVFVLDETGRYLAFGGNPSKVGTRVQDIPGIAGDQLVHDIVAQAQHGPGWVEYDITNPSTGVVQTKMSFVSQVDAGYVGCGVYKTLAAR